MYAWSFIMILVSIMIFYGVGVKILSDETTEPVLTIIETFDATQYVEQDATFIFGNFFAVAGAFGSLLFSTVTGGIVWSVFSEVPFTSNLPTMLFIRGLYTFATLMWIFQIITGRMQ